MSCDMNCFDCKNELNLCKLCASKAKIKHLCSENIVSDNICSDNIQGQSLSIQSELANDICAQSIKGKQIGALSLNANNLCAQNGTINNLCVDNLTAGAINNCVKWRAAVGLTADSVYTLGADINWNAVVDDPNNNVALAPFSYTVPTSGYYSLTFDINHHGLAGASPIAGIPVGLLTIEKNGTLIRNTYAPFLSFSTSQNSALSTLALLNAGDVIKMHYDVLVLDTINGLIPYIGTVILEGNNEFDGKSGFAIHYLSSLNCTPGAACSQCPVVDVPCQPLSIDCDMDNPVTMKPAAAQPAAMQYKQQIAQPKQQAQQRGSAPCVSCE